MDELSFIAISQIVVVLNYIDICPLGFVVVLNSLLNRIFVDIRFFDVLLGKTSSISYNSPKFSANWPQEANNGYCPFFSFF